MFTKTTKRVISLILCVLMFVPFVTMAGAYVEVETKELLTARDNFGPVKKGPETSGIITEYNFYDPVRGTSNNTTKYPVVFLMGKTTTEDTIGTELRETSFAMWTTAEYQKRFYESNGAYIVNLRVPPVKEDNILGFGGNETKVRASIKATMEGFIAQHEDNVDQKRIYIVAWDDSCKLAINLVAKDGAHIAAMILSSPTYLPESKDLTNMSHVPVWLVACDKDTAVDYQLSAWWDGLKNNTGERIRTRFTSFTSFNTRGQHHHETWEYVAYDANYTGQHTGAKTVHGEDKAITVGGEDGFIAWLSKIGSNYGNDCICPCHGATGWDAVLWFFKWMISMMLKITKNQECACGKMHW